LAMAALICAVVAILDPFWKEKRAGPRRGSPCQGESSMGVKGWEGADGGKLLGGKDK